jgi:hypothetical protein
VEASQLDSIVGSKKQKPVDVFETLLLRENILQIINPDLVSYDPSEVQVLSAATLLRILLVWAPKLCHTVNFPFVAALNIPMVDTVNVRVRDGVDGVAMKMKSKILNGCNRDKALCVETTVYFSLVTDGKLQSL